MLFSFFLKCMRSWCIRCRFCYGWSYSAQATRHSSTATRQHDNAVRRAIGVFVRFVWLLCYSRASQIDDDHDAQNCVDLGDCANCRWRRVVHHHTRISGLTSSPLILIKQLYYMSVHAFIQCRRCIDSCRCVVSVALLCCSTVRVAHDRLRLWMIHIVCWTRKFLTWQQTTIIYSKTCSISCCQCSATNVGQRAIVHRRVDITRRSSFLRSLHDNGIELVSVTEFSWILVVVFFFFYFSERSRGRCWRLATAYAAKWSVLKNQKTSVCEHSKNVFTQSSFLQLLWRISCRVCSVRRRPNCRRTQTNWYERFASSFFGLLLVVMTLTKWHC